MGLFGKSQDEKVFEWIRTANLDDENEKKQIVDYFNGHMRFERGDTYTRPLHWNLLVNIANEDVANFMTNKYVVPVEAIETLFECWKYEEAVNSNNIFRAAINNKSFKKLFIKEEFNLSAMSNFFDGYCDEIFGLEEAKDENSIIFNRDLWNYDEDEIRRYIEIDNSFRDDPEARRAYLYNDNGSLRDLEAVEGYLAKGNVSDKL